MLIIYAYSPFISGYNFGSTDAQIYQYELHDALIQLRHGIFPVYIGQSEFNYFGVSFMRAPYYLLFGQLLDIITLHQFNALYIQHLTVLVSAVLAGLITYTLMIITTPVSRWIPLLLSFLYATCPGAMSLIYVLDMYFSFLALPYLPLIIYGLIRFHQKKDILAHIITGTGLSFVLLAHPPIAFWCFLSCSIFYLFQLIFFRRGLLGLFMIATMIILLNLWQLISIFELGLNDITSSYYKPILLKYVSESINLNFKGAFLPLSDQINGILYLQLGYPLLIILLGSMIVGICQQCFLIRSFLLITLMLIIFIFPIPVINNFLWEHMPINILQVNLWPMQRIYMLLAIISCFLGLLAIKEILPLLKNSLRYALLFLGIILSLWNIYQVQFFIKSGEIRRDKNDYWLKSENIFLFQQLNYALFSTKNKVESPGTYIPQLKNKLINETELSISGYDNEQILIQQCVKSLSTNQHAKLVNNVKFPLRIYSNDAMIPIFNMTLLSSDPHVFFCMLLDSDANAVMQLQSAISLSAGYPYIAGVLMNKTSAHIENKILTMPIYNPSTSKNDLTIYFRGSALIKEYKLINYDLNKLPIHVESLTPYRATVETNQDNVYLDMYKSYYPGYQAKLNGKIVPVLQTKNDNIKILLPNKGKYQIELEYIGTRLMRISFYISVTAWSMLLAYFIFIWTQRKTVKFRV